MILVCLVFGGIFLWKRKTPVVYSSSPVFCLLMLGGSILTYLSFLPYIGVPSVASCVAPVFLFPCAFAIIFGSSFLTHYCSFQAFAEHDDESSKKQQLTTTNNSNLLAKTFRIYQIFSNKTLRNLNPTTVKMLGISGVIFLVEMVCSPVSL